MAGIEAAEEMTSDQLDAMAGGDLLKNEVNWQLHEYSIITCLMQINYKKLFLSRPVTLVKSATRRNPRSV